MSQSQQYIKWEVELTDTFGGEANYSWCRRATIETPAGVSTAGIMRVAKKALSLTGTKGKTSQLGEGYEFRPYGSCTVLFVTPRY